MINCFGAKFALDLHHKDIKYSKLSKNKDYVEEYI